jgi:hypothetical protein
MGQVLIQARVARAEPESSDADLSAVSESTRGCNAKIARFEAFSLIDLSTGAYTLVTRVFL